MHQIDKTLKALTVAPFLMHTHVHTLVAVNSECNHNTADLSVAATVRLQPLRHSHPTVCRCEWHWRQGG